MPTMTYAIAYLLTAAGFLALDSVWLTTTVDRLYRPAIGSMMLERPALAPAAMLYAIYVVGIVWFAVLPALEARRPSVGLGNGMLLGLVAYAIYDLTNQATLKGWPWHLTAIDLVWGTVATGAAAAFGAWATPIVGRWLGSGA